MREEFPSANIERSNKYEITECGIDQLEQIVFVNDKIFKGMYEKDPYSLDQYQEKLKNLQPKIFVAKVNDQIIGDSISFEKNNSLYLWIMGVLEEYRNKGIAVKLFERNEQFARENKYESITVKVYNVSKEMLKLLLTRNYEITDVEKSKTDPKYNAVHLTLKM
ncbi:MAG: GNAT family N-acetyltransferase [Parcubacteria group bacterium]|jgi:GNAT superfamily N-acetyltransferase